MSSLKSTLPSNTSVSPTEPSVFPDLSNVSPVHHESGGVLEGPGAIITPSSAV